MELRALVFNFQFEFWNNQNWFQQLPSSRLKVLELHVHHAHSDLEVQHTDSARSNYTERHASELVGWLFNGSELTRVRYEVPALTLGDSHCRGSKDFSSWDKIVDNWLYCHQTIFTRSKKDQSINLCMPNFACHSNPLFACECVLSWLFCWFWQFSNAPKFLF